ncbi:DUF2812 domain-containing protein, partial [Eubacteriales bacterium OttesenSCG-928-K08]|nr:DUF2812 domain-containing protein [Eubacteriales bacterium OttesenSCG-928-K08]
MRVRLRKVFLAWQHEKEEQWLRELSAKGLALVGVGFCSYEFEDCDPGEYVVRLELLKNWPTHPESRKYIQFVEEMGAQHIGSLMRWVYFRKKTADGDFDLFSDLDSKCAHFSRIALLMAPISLFNIIVAVNNILLGIGHGFHGNLYIGLFGMVIGAILLYGTVRVLLHRRKLNKTRVIQ